MHFYARVFVIASALKLLLIPAYTSTDFEVHRNWMAITSRLPLREWYFEGTSRWTLDYPPLFALFEWLLSLAARMVVPDALSISTEPIMTWKLLVFHRVSVVVADAVLLWGASRLAAAAVTQATFLGSSVTSQRLITCMVFFHPGLIIVDHVHFQYNGFLVGILCVATSFLIQAKLMLASIYFVALVCFKHTFIYAGPAVAVLLYKASASRTNFVLSCAFGITVAVLIFAPFLASAPRAQAAQILSRLFPFERGLVHEYWAPNVWALYCAADKMFRVVLRRPAQLPLLSTGHSSLSLLSPVVVLPAVTPFACATLLFAGLLLCATQAARKPAAATFVLTALTASFMCGFMLGWHVHEKAVLVPLILFAFQSLQSRQHMFVFFEFSSLATYSLFPLLFRPTEAPLLLLLFASYHASIILFVEHSCALSAPSTESHLRRGFGTWSGIPKLHKIVCLSTLIVEAGRHALALTSVGRKLPFLPLLLVSVFCAVGLLRVIFLQSRLV